MEGPYKFLQWPQKRESECTWAESSEVRCEDVLLYKERQENSQANNKGGTAYVSTHIYIYMHIYMDMKPVYMCRHMYIHMHISIYTHIMVTPQSTNVQHASCSPIRIRGVFTSLGCSIDYVGYTFYFRILSTPGCWTGVQRGLKGLTQMTSLHSPAGTAFWHWKVHVVDYLRGKKEESNNPKGMWKIVGVSWNLCLGFKLCFWVKTEKLHVCRCWLHWAGTETTHGQAKRGKHHCWSKWRNTWWGIWEQRQE